MKVNGCVSSFFHIKRGTRQGCPLSPLLFAISMEPLAELIRTHANVRGVSSEMGEIHKISLYADDIMLYINEPITDPSVKAVLK